MVFVCIYVIQMMCTIFGHTSNLIQVKQLIDDINWVIWRVVYQQML